MPWVIVPHLASHILGRMARMLSSDWQRLYANPSFFVEIFIDPQRFRGTCYRAAKLDGDGGDHGARQGGFVQQGEPIDQAGAGLPAGEGLSPAAFAGAGIKPPELVSTTQEEPDEILALAKTTFPAKPYPLLEGMLTTLVFVMRALQNAKTSVKRFRQRLFGARTESKSKLFKTPGVASAADEAAWLVHRHRPPVSAVRILPPTRPSLGMGATRPRPIPTPRWWRSTRPA